MDSTVQLADVLNRHTQCLGASRARCALSRVLVGQSWKMIAASRRLVGPTIRIAGGGDDDLRESVRRRLDSGTLCVLDGHAWAGPATGQPCIVCRRSILPPEIEYEVHDPYHAFAHLSCFTVWLDESTAVRSRRGRSDRRPARGSSADTATVS